MTAHATKPPPGAKPPSKRRRRPAKVEAGAPGARSAAPRAGWRRWAPWAAGAGMAALAALSFYLFVLYPSSAGPGDAKEPRAVEVTLADGEGASEIAHRLEDAGVVASARLFALFLWLHGGVDGIARGAHLLTDDASPRELLARLERHGAARVKVTFPEGWSRFQMAKRLEEKHVTTAHAFLQATTDRDLLRRLRIDGTSAEGFLFPATYELANDADPADVITTLKEEFDRRWASLEQKHASGLLDLARGYKLTEKDVVTLASMVEKEAVHDDERPTIASVFLNRLGNDFGFTPKYLGCDPTAGYGCLVAQELGLDVPSCAGYGGKITPAINADAKNPYSTYKHEGLPPGPIASPGAKSLEAVMAPATTRYLYFVATGDRRHTFSESLGTHSAVIGRHPQ